MTDIVEFQRAARRFLRARKITDEDVLSEMVLYALARGNKPTKLRYAYLRALDNLSPRVTLNGEKTYRAALDCELDADSLVDEINVAPEQVMMAQQEEHTAIAETRQAEALLVRALPAQGWLRALLLLRFIHGYKISELATLFGLSQWHIARLTGTQGAPRVFGLSTDEEMYFDSPDFGVEWLQL